MQSDSKVILEDNGIEILVGYDFEKSPSQVEEGHGEHEVGNRYYTELTSVEVIISGVGIDILPQLNTKQKDAIIFKIYN